MICPRCLYEQPNSNECVRCGIVIEKFIEANPHEFDDGKELPDLRSTRRIYKKAYITNTKGAKVSSSVGWFTVVCVIILFGYSAMVFANTLTSKNRIADQMIKSLQTTLRHELKEAAILDEVLMVGYNNRVEIVEDDVIIEFSPDTVPISNNRINYIITISVPFRVPVFSYHFVSTANVTVYDFMRDDGSRKSTRLKDLLDLGDWRSTGLEPSVDGLL